MKYELCQHPLQFLASPTEEDGDLLHLFWILKSANTKEKGKRKKKNTKEYKEKQEEEEEKMENNTETMKTWNSTS